MSIICNIICILVYIVLIILFLNGYGLNTCFYIIYLYIISFFSEKPTGQIYYHLLFLLFIVVLLHIYIEYIFIYKPMFDKKLDNKIPILSVITTTAVGDNNMQSEKPQNAVLNVEDSKELYNRIIHMGHPSQPRTTNAHVGGLPPIKQDVTPENNAIYRVLTDFNLRIKKDYKLYYYSTFPSYKNDRITELRLLTDSQSQFRGDFEHILNLMKQPNRDLYELTTTLRDINFMLKRLLESGEYIHIRPYLEVIQECNQYMLGPLKQNVPLTYMEKVLSDLEKVIREQASHIYLRPKVSLIYHRDHQGRIIDNDSLPIESVTENLKSVCTQTFNLSSINNVEIIQKSFSGVMMKLKSILDYKVSPSLSNKENLLKFRDSIYVLKKELQSFSDNTTNVGTFYKDAYTMLDHMIVDLLGKHNDIELNKLYLAIFEQCLINRSVSTKIDGINVLSPISKQCTTLPMSLSTYKYKCIEFRNGLKVLIDNKVSFAGIERMCVEYHNHIEDMLKIYHNNTDVFISINDTLTSVLESVKNRSDIKEIRTNILSMIDLLEISYKKPPTFNTVYEIMLFDERLDFILFAITMGFSALVLLYWKICERK